MERTYTPMLRRDERVGALFERGSIARPTTEWAWSLRSIVLTASRRRRRVRGVHRPR